MRSLRTTLWWAYGPLIAVASIAPAMLDQGSLDAAPPAWRLLTLWAALSFLTASLMISRPVIATCLSFAVVGVIELVASAQETELSFLDILPAAACLFMTGALASRRGVVGAMAFIAAATSAGVLANRLSAPKESQGGLDIVAGLLALTLAALGGIAVRAHRQAAEDSQQQYESERRARTLAEADAARRERLRIAREMHDLVAHSVTLLVVNAETLRARRSELPTWAADQADAMAEAGRRASVEMSEMLRLLRDNEETLKEGAGPGLADVSALVAEAVHAGMEVGLREDGTPRVIDWGTSLCAYRVVQEALSNIRKHDPHAKATVTVHWGSDTLTVDVHSLGGMPADQDVRSGAGLGLLGLRERVNDLGGSISAGHDVDGHHVRALLPLLMKGPERKTGGPIP